MDKSAHLCASHTSGHQRSDVRPMLTGSTWLIIACWNLVMKRGWSATPRKYLLQRFQTSACTLGQLLTTCKKHVRVSLGATRAHRNMVCSSDSTLRHTTLVGAVVSCISLKQAYTTHPPRSTDTASDCTKCTRTRQLWTLRYLALEHSAAKALRVARILSNSNELGLEPV